MNPLLKCLFPHVISMIYTYNTLYNIYYVCIIYNIIYILGVILLTLSSYKLWYNYLKLRRRQVKGKCVTDVAYEEVNNAFERCLIFLHKVRASEVVLYYIGK